LVYLAFLIGFPQNEFYADLTKSSLVDLTNRNRATFNLPPLKESPQLDAAAYLKALDMEKMVILLILVLPALPLGIGSTK